MRKKYTPPQSQTIPLDVSGNMMDVITVSKPGGNPTTIRIGKRPDTFSPFTQEEEEDDDRKDATLWEF